jgi:hypothetical protein
VHRPRWLAQKYRRWLAATITQVLLADHPQAIQNTTGR